MQWIRLTAISAAFVIVLLVMQWLFFIGVFGCASLRDGVNPNLFENDFTCRRWLTSWFLPSLPSFWLGGLLLGKSHPDASVAGTGILFFPVLFAHRIIPVGRGLQGISCTYLPLAILSYCTLAFWTAMAFPAGPDQVVNVCSQLSVLALPGSAAWAALRTYRWHPLIIVSAAAGALTLLLTVFLNISR